MNQGGEPSPWHYVFNTPLECGLRSAVVLAACYPRHHDLQRLVTYDYIVVHSGDIPEGPPSVHPGAPGRSGELLVRRLLVRNGLDFMLQRGIVERVYLSTGIAYRAGEYAIMFLGSLSSPYVLKLKAVANWIAERFGSATDAEMTRYARSQLTQWGAEFASASYFDGDQ